MKKIELEYQKYGVETFTGLIDQILQECDYNLDQFVKGNSLAITSDKSEKFQIELRKLIEMAPMVFREANNKDKFFSALKEKDYYEKNEKFFNFLEKYIDVINKPYEEAAFLRNMKQEVFEKMSLYCLENMILSVINKDNLDETFGEEKHMFLLRKIMFTFINMFIVDNYSREYAISSMEEMFGINKEYCEFWWNLIEKNDDKLWRITVMKKYNRIENKLNQLLNSLEN